MAPRRHRKQNPKSEYRNPKQTQRLKVPITKSETGFVWNFLMFYIQNCFEFRISSFEFASLFILGAPFDRVYPEPSRSARDMFCAFARVTLALVAASPRLAGAGRGPLAVAPAFDVSLDSLTVHPAGVLSAACCKTDLIAVKLA